MRDSQVEHRGLAPERPAMKPSDVNLRCSFPPLVDTMGSTEAEQAAAMLVRACQVRGDVWQDIEARTLGEIIKADLAAGNEPFASMNRNPFCRPDAYDLVKRGCAEWVGEPGKVLRFTELGLEKLRKAARP